MIAVIIILAVIAVIIILAVIAVGLSIYRGICIHVSYTEMN